LGVEDMSEFDFIIPKKLYAVLFYDKINPEYKGILHANGTDLYLGNSIVPFESLKEAEEAAEKISYRQATKIIWWNLYQRCEELDGFEK
jgi:hypothetical protein